MRSFFKTLLSGLISATSDNDPTTVATLAVVGASTAYRLEWLLIVIIPMLMIVQAIGTHVGTITRNGLQAVVRSRFGTRVAMLSLIAIVAVNAITFAADLRAGASALGMLTPIADRFWIAPVTIAVVVLLTFGTFERIRSMLMIPSCAFLGYVISAVLAHPNGAQLAQGFIPRLSELHGDLIDAVALIGTSLTTYTYLWQTTEIATDAPPKRFALLIDLSTLPGILVTGVVFFSILVATAATLGVHHHSVHSADEASQALAPLAGRWASIVFGVGLLGSSLLALPVIAASTATACAGTFQLRGSIDDRPPQAKAFYACLYALVAAGFCLTSLPSTTITLLFWASIAGGFATPITMSLLVLIARDARVMRLDRIGLGPSIAGWGTAALISLASLAAIVQSVLG